MELTKILQDEAWIEGERRKEAVTLSDPAVFKRSIKIWEEQYEKLAKKSNLADKNTEEV